MFIRPLRSQPLDTDIHISYHGAPPKIVQKTRCLGVIVDDRLTWTSHVDCIAAKIGRKVGALRRARRQLTPAARRQFYISVIQRDLEYGAIAFSPSLPAAERQRLLGLFRRAVRAAAAVHPQAEVEPLLQDMAIVDIRLRWIFHMGLFAFQCCKEPAAACLRDMFPPCSSKYNTRGKVNGSLLIVQHKSKSGVNSITNRLSLLWNALPAKLKSCSSSHQFRGEFIEILQSDEKLVIHLFSLMFGNVVSV